MFTHEQFLNTILTRNKFLYTGFLLDFTPFSLKFMIHTFYRSTIKDFESFKKNSNPLSYTVSKLY